MRTPLHILAISILLGVSVLVGLEYVFAPVVIAQGHFHSVAHEGAGIAVLYRFPDGKRSLRLMGLSTALRQDLAVYLISAADAFDNETVAGSRFISLGALKSSAEDQVYDVPSDVDLSRYHAVTIWSQKYRVNFTTVPLR